LLYTFAEPQTNETEQAYTIEQSIENLEACKMVRQAVKRLSLPLKTVIILYYFDDMSIQEISTVLNCFQGTVKSRLHNARKHLAKDLRSYF
jgi:RNA polymerase sigma factor (sigma-70 family)